VGHYDAGMRHRWWVVAPRAAIGLLVLIGITLACKWLQMAGHLRLPGPVIGLALLAGLLLITKQVALPVTHQLNIHLEPVAKVLLRYMGLLFVPAGVGVITQGKVIREQWPAITIAVIGSTVLGLVATGWTTQRFAKRADR
jgi:putative effector of murein hydrolase LrgA (UPF0299 family)